MRRLPPFALCILDVFAAPAAAVDKVPDPRSSGQRQHDGLVAALETLQRCGDLPTRNGVSATLVLTLSAEQYRTGLATTGHGHPVPPRNTLHDTRPAA